ncbi:class I SAM-dependent methyltransferase [Candidatus Altiarchaeota archaeon]
MFGSQLSADKSVPLLKRLYLRILGSPKFGLRLRALHFQKQLPNRSFQRILDAGCGNGVYSFHLAQRFPNAEVIGIDTDTARIERNEKIRKNLSIKNLSFRNEDILDLSYKEKFDLIVSIDVIEQIKDISGFIQKLNRLLTPNGILYVHTPTENWHKKNPPSNTAERGYPLRHSYSREDLMHTLLNSGFQIIKERSTFGSLAAVLWKIDAVMRRSQLGFLSPLAFPVLLVLSLPDMFSRNKCGGGILILAKKS